jgi:UDP-GlcNAc:undecaprenyl-phosphate GlcNAc-1-phosphate transferase
VPATLDNILWLILTASAAYGLSVLSIPPLIRFAVAHEWLDVPEDNRRVHTVPVPRLGGVALVVAAAVAAAVPLLIAASAGQPLLRQGHLLPAFIVGTMVVFFTGVVDDLVGLSPGRKLLAQIVAAIIIVSAGFRLDALTLVPGGAIFSTGPFAAPLALLWIVGVTNAFNLIDGIDGLAGTIAVFAILAMMFVEFVASGMQPFYIPVAVLGATLGFLKFNGAPARIFLGDGGSMALGYFLAVRSVLASTGPRGDVYALLPIVILAFPLLDTFLAMGRRWLRGIPISSADGRHVHHQLLALGLTTQQTVRLIGGAALCFSALGISIVFAPPQLTLALMLGGGGLAILFLFYAVRWLEYGEFMELGASAAATLRHARGRVRNRIRAAEIAERVREAKSFEEVQAALAELTDDVRLLDVQLLEGDVHSHGPQRQQISPVDKLPVRLDYPCAWEQDGQVREVILRLWSDRPTLGGPQAVEQIAARVGPALEAWLREHRPAIREEPGVQQPARRISLPRQKDS